MLLQSHSGTMLSARCVLIWRLASSASRCCTWSSAAAVLQLGPWRPAPTSSAYLSSRILALILKLHRSMGGFAIDLTRCLLSPISSTASVLSLSTWLNLLSRSAARLW